MGKNVRNLRGYVFDSHCILDSLVPVQQIERRPRPSNPWFDQECRDAKRLTRRLERAYSAASCRLCSGSAAAAAVVAAIKIVVVVLPTLRKLHGTTRIDGIANFGMLSAVRSGVR